MKALHYSCQGESHIQINKVCQDASYSHTDESLSIAIVSDGHGGSRYFRSDVGSQLAIESCNECVVSFVNDVDKRLLLGKSFSPKKAITSEACASQFTKETETDKAFRQLFSSIIYSWTQKIANHARNNPITEDERALVPGDYLNDFTNGIGIERTYGCTLMCYACTHEGYWFAFHIGDGKCISFDKDGIWKEPIPWDERCFLNKTTSLCDSTAINEFRYCYCGNGSFPIAFFLGSDGIDDSFGETENMVNFYIQILKLIANENGESALEAIKGTLPQLSKMGSKDDMTVACIYNEHVLSEHIKGLVGWQRKYVEKNICTINERIINLRKKIGELKSNKIIAPKSVIDFQYAKKQLAKAFEDKRKLVDRWNKFARELSGEEFCPYNDTIGIYETGNPGAEEQSGTPMPLDNYQQQ